MIKKKNNTYNLIKKNIAKLAIIQQTTNISPNRLVSIFLKNLSSDEILLQKKTKEGYWDWKLADNTAYKYFKKELSTYLKTNLEDTSFRTMKEYFKSNYLTKDYFGENYASLADNYFAQELTLKNFVRESFISVYPITPEMTPTEVAIRNQKLGKISVKHWIGDIINYDYFSQAPGFMMNNVQQALQYIDLYIMNVLNEKQLDHELVRLSTNQRLEVKLQPKQTVKNKTIKI
ncbi:hypothetical protein [Ralstonia solanacearum]|uniref:hypothetical protein n=1 Tax=Ralstonia solanacearum TaxID=305 RepID=UPI002029CB53|nr:hypothetical protein [Ralstonia solanacearum]MCL9844633.1 hypothetical protein [Ralstonia solanacearum]MDC6253148.1 hypothetical protein [Ralstonia solanacearum]MDC6257730.1 hypothetical protein [Ralstonia solanacearum]MDC6301614.1 hypothetical protein [Ralstonia solanacearum]